MIRTRDPPNCSAVPQPTAPPRAATRVHVIYFTPETKVRSSVGTVSRNPQMFNSIECGCLYLISPKPENNCRECVWAKIYAPK